MKEPCKDCPFKKSNTGYGLSKVKAQQILTAITHDGDFPCHKTLDYSEGNDGERTKRTKLCFGAVLFLENTVHGGCRSNVSFRIGLAKKEFTVADLRQDYDLIYGSFKEFKKGVIK